MKTKLLSVVSVIVFSVLVPVYGYASHAWSKAKDHTTPNNATPLLVQQGSIALPTGASSSWWGSVQEGLRKSEYRITWQEQTHLANIKAAYQAPNRAHNLRTYFTTEGIQVIPRVLKEPEWVWGLRLKSWGFDGEVGPVKPAKPSVSGNRVEYVRGDLTEWYVNDEQGLEQGFTLHGPPKSGNPQTASWVVLKMDLLGSLKGTINGDANAIDFVTGGGASVVHFSGLHAFDATGKSLPSKFTLVRGMLDIFVDTRGALYPIIVDPLATSPDWTANGDGNFGFSVGTAGDVNGDGYSDVIVGAVLSGGEGRAYVYYGSASGLSTTADWTAESNQAEAEFGCSVGTAGDVNGDGYSDVIVGARLFDNGETDEGRAYVYYGSASGLSTTADWTAESDHVDANFGYAVGTAGDVNGDGYSDVIVGAPHYTGTDTDESKAYVYYGSASGLSLSAAWVAETGQAGAYFGWSVGTAGDVNGDGYSDIIVGAYGYDGGQTDEGRAFVYHGSASGLSTTADWTAECNKANAQFGWSVATAGDVNGDGFSDIIIGANHYDITVDNGYYTEAGKAFVYHGSASGLSTTPNWTADGDRPSAEFGCSVGTAGDVNGDGYDDVIVGAGFRLFPGFFYQGAAYMYHGSASGLSTTFDWRIGGDPYDVLGYSVGTAGDVNSDGYSDVIMGAPDNGPGKAYVYYGCVTGTSTDPAWMVESDQVDACFGSRVATAGDVNGDGYSDVIVAASAYDNGGTTGKVFLYYGSASGLSTSAAWAAESPQADARFGNSVGTAGDVNGDGYDDVIVSAYLLDNGETNEGAAFVYYGSPSGLSATANWMAEGDYADAYFGYAAGTAGDVNGDGYSDVIVGAPFCWCSWTGPGRAYVYYGSASGLSTAAGWTVEGDQNFGFEVASAGDVNDDGISDVIVGAMHFDSSSGNYCCIASVYHGSASGLSPTANWTSETFWARHSSAFSAATAGDVNGDGYSDVIIGAYHWDDWWGQEGSASVYHGSALGLSPTADWTAQADLHSVAFGCSVGTAGDVNGDGYSDVIVGAYYYTHLEFAEGAVFVYHGSASGLSPTANWTMQGGQEYAYYGLSAGTAGDVNGDGYSDIIVGAYGYETSDVYYEYWGAAYVYQGSASGLLFGPVANFTAIPRSGDWPLEVTFTDASTPEGEIQAWEWDFDNDGTPDSSEQNPSYQYDAAGTYTVKLSVTSPGGTDSETKIDYITVIGPPVAAFTANKTSGTVPLDVQFTDQSTGSITSWHWDFGDTGSSSDQNPLHTYTSAEDFTVSLTVTSPGGTNSETKVDYIHVDEPLPPAAAFMADVTTGTKPLSVQFYDQSTGPITSWSWTFGDGGSSVQQNPPHQYTDAGDYTVSLTVTGPGGSDSQTNTDYIHVTEPSGVPVIDKIAGTKEAGKKIRIIGSGFGDTQGDSVVHLGNRTYDSSKLRIKLWSDTMIKIKLPNYACTWFKRDVRRLKVWVTVGSVDSNVKNIRVQKPDTCP